MKSLFILQLVCCVITAMLALQLAMASLQVRWKVWRYEISRWILVASMLFFSVHYLLQMVHGLRAQGTDVGAAFNILFYTPVAFAITLSIINIESTGNKVRRYCLRSMMAYILIAIVFVIGMFKSQSLHIGNMLYVMLGLFVASMAYFIFIIRKEANTRRQKLMENFGSDLISYVRYSQASLILLNLTAVNLAKRNVLDLKNETCKKIRAHDTLKQQKSSPKRAAFIVFERRTNSVQTRFKLCGIRLHEHHIFVICVIVHMRIELETLTTFERIAERFILA